MKKLKKKKPAVFLDRDGTILNERGYLGDPAKMKFYPWAFSALKSLSKMGFSLVVITNQSGVGRGYFSETQLKRVNRAFSAALARRKIKLGGIFYCPHRPDQGCACRKPGTALVRRAVSRLNLDMKKSYAVGDQPRDIQMGLKAGAKPVLVLTGGGLSARRKLKGKKVKVAKNLKTASRWIGQDFLKGK